MPQIPDLQFGLPESELVIARRVLGVAEGEPLNVQQLKAWKLTRDTYLNDLWASHPGSAAEQFGGGDDRPVVQTKRTVARWRG